MIGTHPKTYISRIRHCASGLIRLNSAKRIVFRRSALLSQKVEERALPHVRQAHAAHLEILPDAAEGDDIVLWLFGRCFLWWHF